MDAATAAALLAALRAAGHYPAADLDAAAALVARPADEPGLADHLLTHGLITPYQHKKVRGGRVAEVLFGPFLILDKLGEGGMGKVYRAVQTEPTAGGPAGRLVALKIVRHHLMANPTVRKRYEREAAAVAALDHPNIVKLFAASDIQGRYFLAMEYVDGIDLARLVREFGDPPNTGLASYQEACEYARQAALGLAHAHGRGLIHRDVKPANLLVRGDRALPGTAGTAAVKILDMGLVRSILDEDDGRTDLTRDGTVVGTPDYMSPEQAKNSSTVDPRADLYSLGCALYYLLRGQPPYPAGTPIDKLLRHQLDPVPDLKKARPDIPAAVADVVTKLLQKKPDHRYQSAAEVAAALAPFGAGSATLPAHEPFSFTDDPDAVHTAASPPTAGPPDAPPKPAGPRLRVVSRPPASGPARPRGPVAIPKPSQAASPDTPSGTVRVPRARPADRTPSSGVVTGRHRRPAPPPEPAVPAWVWWAAGVAAAAVVLGVALVLALGRAKPGV